MQIPVPQLQQCWFLAGPTAAGKTELSLLLAREIGGEIISLDSMALYRGMDVGTAKPSLAERREVRHHLIDIIDPHEEFSAAAWLAAAAQAVDEILQRDQVPLFVGGTGLYLRAALRGVFSGPPADPEWRSAIEMETADRPAGWLHARLHEIDPETASKLHPRDVRRLIRALEIHHLTGLPPSTLRAERPLPPEQRPKNVFWLHPPRSWLHARIDQRVEQMFAHGLVDEVRRLLSLPKPPGKTARQALGYREVMEWLDRGTGEEGDVIALIQQRTRQFAKRQHTWFRNLEECREVPLDGSEGPEKVCQMILQMAGRAPIP